MNTSQSECTAPGADVANARNLEADHSHAVALACLYPLVLFNLIQVFAAFSGIEPHPPLQVVPLIAATAGLGVGAIPLVQKGIRSGYILAILFALISMIGMGPHKLFMDDGMIIAPVAIVGFVAAVLLLITSFKMYRDTAHH